MKILCLSHLFPNSIYPSYGVFVKERLKAVSQLIDCRIVAPVPFFPGINITKKYRNLDKVPKSEIIDGLSVSHPRYFMIPKYFKYFDKNFYYFSLNKFISDIQGIKSFDIIDVHWLYPDAAAAIKWAKKFNVKLVVTVRGYESIYYHETKKNISIKKIISKILTASDHIISVSTDLKNILVNEYNIDPIKISTITNGIDCNKFYLLEKNEARSICNFKKRNKNIITVCRLSYEKGLDNLINAIAILDRNDVRLTIIGDGPNKNELKKLSKNLGVSHQIDFIQKVNHEELKYWYNAADIFCLSSLWEGCPNVVIEALSCGTPVVSTFVGAVSDFIRNKDTGMIVEENSPYDLAVAIKKALNKEWDRELICSVGSENTWDFVAEKVVSVFKKVIL